MFRRSYPFLILAGALFAFNFSLGVSRSIQNNFWVDVLGLHPTQMGLLITGRELLGFLTILMVGATMRFAPSRLAGACFVVMFVGYFAYGLATSLLTILPGVMIASAGFHTWQILSNSFSLAVAKEENAGRVLGDLQSVGFVAAFLGLIGVFVGIGTLGYQVGFAISGVAMLVGAVAILRFPNEIVHRSPQRIVVRGRYRLYYALNFLEGCRFELFQAFGIFLLVETYRLPVQTIAILFMLSMVGSALLSPIVGRTIDRVGERIVMSVGYVLMLGTFLGFALWHDTLAVTILYVIYTLVTLSEIGVNTYLKKVAPPEDVRPSLATGMTMMHIPALIVPILAGALWNAFGFEVPFLLGAAFIAGSIVATQLIPPRVLSPTFAEAGA